MLRGNETGTLSVSPTRRGRLFRKYVVILVVLVSGALLTSGLVEAYFSSEENKAAVIRLQRERAVAAASTIEQFLGENGRLLGWVALDQSADAATPPERSSDYGRLLGLAPAIRELSYIDASGREQVLVSRLAQSRLASQVDRSREPWFTEAKVGGISFGPVGFRDGSSPVLTLGMAGRGAGAGVVAADLDLQLIWDVIARASSDQDDQAYLVDAQGRLIAHPDSSLVLQGTDLSSSAQVQAVRAGPPQGRQQFGNTAVVDALGPSVLVVSNFDQSDQRVYGSSSDRLVAYQVIQPPGWILFVDQPLEQAFAPVRASILRTLLLLLLGLVPAVLASMVLVRWMVTPIQALRAGAARIGTGALDQRIEIRTGDELEALADEFNAMAGQLQESYANLEQKIEDRTRELETVSKHKSEFLASMSHELRTPLNAIIGFSEVLIEKMFGELNEHQEDYLNDILSSGRHLLSLINDILDLSKVEAGRMELELGEFSLREALDNGLTMLKERAGRHSIALGLEIEDGLDLVEADERKVKQIVFNLLSNAVKFTPDGGRVDLRARRVGQLVEVAVQDSGVGIAPEDQERVFEEFRQAGSSTSATQEGTGLGLALVKKFVELHGGQIGLRSEVGVGSTFTFTIPARQATTPPEDLSTGRAAELDELVAAPPPSGQGGSLTVLLVEDDPRSIDLLTLYLHGVGYEVAVARDGEEGLELARRLRPAVITLDLCLPRLDGWEFLARAKADPSIADIPVVIVSIVDERGKGFSLGAAEYLVKPVDRDRLLAALARLAQDPPRSHGPARVLAIDDDPLAVELIEAVLAPSGYQVLKASSGEEGLALARHEQPTLVILDLLMPGMDGFAVVERLRADPSTADLPIVILTASNMSTADKARLNGQISYLARKSEFSRAAFLELVQRFCPVAVVGGERDGR